MLAACLSLCSASSALAPVGLVPHRLPAPLQVDPRPVTPYFFSDRSEYIEPELSRRIVAGLRRIGMLDAQGYVTVDPRYTTKVLRCCGALHMSCSAGEGFARGGAGGGFAGAGSSG